MISSINPRVLCESLMRAEAEGGPGGVVDVLSKAGLWDNPDVWRDLGDQPDNYSTVGSQQSRAEQALVEKLVNSVDTKLIAAARMKGIDPEDAASAPASMAEARDLLFGENLKDLDALARSITVAATGARSPGRMCLSIADDGEGQTPSSMPKTILSVLKGSKKRTPFVQGKFHMGGTGVLEFCGLEHNLQFVLSKRNPALLTSPLADPSDGDWSFTIIRREDPEPGGVRSSRFKYLAPGPAGPDGLRALLHFSAETLPIFPLKNQAYAREAAWGTLFKLYEYDTRLRGNIILRDGLMMRVRVMLPEPALPIRFHECREGFKGHTGSFDTTMKGLIGTLDDDRHDEKRKAVEWFDKFELNVDGEPFHGRIYVFKDSKAAEAYRQSEGVVFTYNGQTHAIYTKDFFRRANVKQDYLWQSLLVFVDCSQISPRAHEKLFMASRDRLRDGELKRDLEEALEDQLRSHPKLKEIAAERRNRERAEQPEVSETFRKFLEDMLKRNPALAALLGPGLRIANPYKPLSVVAEDKPWVGERFPTRFHFKGHEHGDELHRDAHLNSQVRIALETDAEDEYFSRDEQPGTFRLFVRAGDEWLPAKNWKSPSLAKGTANFSLALPPDAVVGEKVRFEAVIDDPSRIEPFRNCFELSVKPERVAAPPAPSPTPTPKPPTNKPGQDKSHHGFLDIPEPIEVPEARWGDHDPPFDRFTAMVVKANPDAPEGTVAYDYYVNMDNVHLQAAVKQQPKQTTNLRMQFKIGMSMIALAVVQHDLSSKPKAQQGDDSERGVWEVTDQVKLFTSAIAPFLIPMVASLAKIPEDQPEAMSLAAGEEAA